MRSSAVVQPAVDNTRSSAVRPWAAAEALRAGQHVGHRPAVQRGPGWRSGTIWSPCTRTDGRVVGDADGKIGHRLAERVQRQHRDLAHRRRRRRPRRAGRRCTARCRRLRPSTTSAPIHQIPNSTAAVCQCAGNSTATRLPGPCAQFVAQQVAGLGGPVRQRRGGQLDALAGGVVVVGDPRARRVGAMSGSSMRRADEVTSVDALRVVGAGGDDRRRPGGRRRSSRRPAAAGSAVASVGSLPSSPEPGPV